MPPLAPGSLAIWWNDKFVSGAWSLVIPQGWAPGRNFGPRLLTSRQEVLRKMRLVTRCQGEELVTVMRAGQRLTDYLEKFCHRINQPPGSGLGSR